jgi:hypothetical protein
MNISKSVSVLPKPCDFVIIKAIHRKQEKRRERKN